MTSSHIKFLPCLDINNQTGRNINFIDTRRLTSQTVWITLRLFSAFSHKFKKKFFFDVTFFRVIRYLYETMMKPEEFNRIIIPMRDELKGLARKLTGDDYSAEDLVQEVMLKLWSMRATLDRYENKRALAMTMLRNKYSDQWRHDRLEDGKASATGLTADDWHKAEAKDEADLIRLIVEHLPELQRQIFKMKEIEGYESSEIMKITGCTAESLRQNLSRARRKIREDFIKLTAIRAKRKDLLTL